MGKTLAGAHRTPAQGATRHPAIKILGRALRVTKKPEPEVATTYDQFGSSLFLFASVLTDDVKLAEQLVFQTIIAHQSGSSTLQDLSASVHIAWLAWGQPQSPAESPPTPGRSPGAQLLHEIRGMPADQRAALGLCKYGGHTYRQAADLLDLRPEIVARLLCDTLRILANPLVSRFEPSPAA